MSQPSKRQRGDSGYARDVSHGYLLPKTFQPALGGLSHMGQKFLPHQGIEALTEAFANVKLRSSFESLPTEILYKIFDQAQSSFSDAEEGYFAGRATLCSLCLVSKRMYPVARAILYRKIVVTAKQLPLLYRQLLRDQEVHSLVTTFICHADLTPKALAVDMEQNFKDFFSDVISKGSQGSGFAMTPYLRMLRRMHAELVFTMPMPDVLMAIVYIVLHCMPNLDRLVLRLPVPPVFNSSAHVEWFWARIWSQESFGCLHKGRLVPGPYINTAVPVAQNRRPVLAQKRKWKDDGLVLGVHSSTITDLPKLLPNLGHLQIGLFDQTNFNTDDHTDNISFYLTPRVRGSSHASLRERVEGITAHPSDWRAVQTLWLSTVNNNSLLLLELYSRDVMRLIVRSGYAPNFQVPGGVLTMDRALGRWSDSLRILHLDIMPNSLSRKLIYGLTPALFSLADMPFLTILTVTTEAIFGEPWEMSDMLNRFEDPEDEDADFFLELLPKSLVKLTIIEWWSAHITPITARHVSLEDQHDLNVLMEDFIDCVPPIMERTLPCLRYFDLVGLCFITWETGEPIYGEHWINTWSQEEMARQFQKIGVHFELQVRQVQLNSIGSLTTAIGPNGGPADEVMGGEED